MSVLDRLLAKAAINPNTGCWDWTAAKHKNGYGKFGMNGSTALAHRVSYELHLGPVPKGMLVCHRCDNRACINPEHFFLGTHRDNTGDMTSKGRHGMAKLSEADIRAIRAASGIRQVDLAKQFGVGQAQISVIRRGENWHNII